MLDILKNYLKDNNYYIVMYNEYIYIYKYIEIKKFSDTSIILDMNDFNLKIDGNKMLITKLEKYELLIKGVFNNVSKIKK